LGLGHRLQVIKEMDCATCLVLEDEALGHCSRGDVKDEQGMNEALRCGDNGQRGPVELPRYLIGDLSGQRFDGALLTVAEGKMEGCVQ
jgi:hypothetical protein